MGLWVDQLFIEAFKIILEPAIAAWLTSLQTNKLLLGPCWYIGLEYIAGTLEVILRVELLHLLNTILCLQLLMSCDVVLLAA